MKMNKKYLIISLLMGVISLSFASLFTLKIINFFLYKTHYENKQYSYDLLGMIIFSIGGLILNKQCVFTNYKNGLSRLSFILNILGLLPAAFFILAIIILLVCTPFILYT